MGKDPTEKASSGVGEILLGIFFWGLVGLGVLFSVLAYYLGLIFNFLFVVLLVLVCGVLISRMIGLWRKTLEFGFLRRPLAAESRKYFAQGLNHWLFAALAGFTLQLAVIPAQFSASDFRQVEWWIWASAGFLMLAALIPQRRVRVSTNTFFAAGWIFLGVQLVKVFLPVSKSDAVVLAPPFRGEWYIYHGGRSALFNHHYSVRSQRDALDIAKTVNGREGNRDKTRLESYPAFGQDLYAPADGRVVGAVNDRPDMEIGQTDHRQIVGNHVIIDMGQGRFVLMAHLKKGSVRVSNGDMVKSGEAVAQCGNSGNTSAPHLHLQVQSEADFGTPGLRTFPILFRDVTRVRWGRSERLKEADVRRNDILLYPYTTETERGRAATERDEQ